MHFSNDRFSNKEMGFSGLWVVWSLLGAPGEKKRENQMYLQDYNTYAPFLRQNVAKFRIIFIKFHRFFRLKKFKDHNF